MELFGLELSMWGTPNRFIVDITGDHVYSKLYSMIRHGKMFDAQRWGQLKITDQEDEAFDVQNSTSPRFSPETDRHLRIVTTIRDFECGFRFAATGDEWTVQEMNVKPTPQTSEAVFLSGLSSLAYSMSVTTEFSTCLQRLHPTYKFLEGKEARVLDLIDQGPSTRMLPTDSINGQETVPHNSALIARVQFKCKIPLPHGNFYAKIDDDHDQHVKPNSKKGIDKLEIEVQFLGSVNSFHQHKENV